MNTQRSWMEFSALIGALPTDRAPQVGNSALSFAEIVERFDFLPLARDGQWTTAALIAKGEEPIHMQAEGGELLHAPIVMINVSKGKAAFYMVVPDVLARGPHQYNFGAPFLLPEPENGVPVPTNLACYDDGGKAIDVTGWFITGVIVKEDATPIGEIKRRTNLTMLREGLKADGSIEIEGTTYYLYGLFKKDVNRVAPNRVDAYLSPNKPTAVLVRELAQAM